MGQRTLKSDEKLAIDSILDDAERKCGSRGTFSADLEALDQQCRSIWSDWDFSVPTHKRTPTKDPPAPSPKRPTPAHVSALPEDDKPAPRESADIIRSTPAPKPSPRRGLEPRVLVEASKHRRAPPTQTRVTPAPEPILSSESDEVESTARSEPARARKSPRGKAAPSPGGGRKRAIPKNSVDPYTRADAARLRQDNIELRGQVTRLQAALDRANTENHRLRVEMRKLEAARTKQASIIAYLKEERLYPK
jgi:hypothetical protein